MKLSRLIERSIPEITVAKAILNLQTIPKYVEEFRTKEFEVPEKVEDCPRCKKEGDKCRKHRGLDSILNTKTCIRFSGINEIDDFGFDGLLIAGYHLFVYNGPRKKLLIMDCPPVPDLNSVYCTDYRIRRIIPFTFFDVELTMPEIIQTFNISEISFPTIFVKIRRKEAPSQAIELYNMGNLVYHWDKIFDDPESKGEDSK